MISPERRGIIKQIVIDTLTHAGFNYLPVDIKRICKSYDFIRLIPFSVQMKHRNMTYEEVCKQCGTDDACADYYAKPGKYIIYYNNIQKTQYINSNRYRWSIAHELGHVLLNHHKIYEKTRIYRCCLSDAEYNYLELEADYFAQLILVPHVVLYAFKIQTAAQLKALCKISNPAANKRFRAYNDWLHNVDHHDSYDRILYYFYYTYIFKKHCTTCGACLIQSKGKYCIICGQKTLQWGDGKMIYPKYEINENGKLKECPNCHNEETYIEGNFCQICGVNLVNKCSNPNCSYTNSLPPNARYCPVCGNTSTFFNSNLLKSWNSIEPAQLPDTSPSHEDIEELPFD